MTKTNPATADRHRRAWSLFQTAQFSEAGRLYRQICRKDSRDDSACCMLGIIKARLGNPEEAQSCLRRALAINPSNFDAHLNLGLLQHTRGQAEPALASLHRALQIHPGHPAALLITGNVHAGQDRLTDAAACYDGSLKADPANAMCRGNLANVLAYQGRTEEALAHYRSALAAGACQSGLHSNLLLALHYGETYNPVEVFREHLDWASRYTQDITARTRHANLPDPERPLRIGYVTPDMRQHSVAYFFEPLLAGHDRERFNFFCYAETQSRDATGERLAQLVGAVRTTVGMTDAAVAAMIEKDRIDILVDLAGHTENNRLTVFAFRPAPVQMTYLGYPDTTGLAAIDYRITDALSDPPGQTDRFHSEKLLRLERCFLCYTPPAESSAISPLPADAAGCITFGSYNARTKITAEIVALWAGVLKAVPGSRLFIKNRQLTDRVLQQELFTMLEGQGIAPQRVTMQGRTSKAMHMDSYGRVDIALDTYPYNGTTTTCDALWMGVPVISRCGYTHVSRVGVSLLSAVGLESLVAENDAEYMACAASLAGNVSRLRQIRSNLRDVMRDSRLCGRRDFAREMETVYRDAWRNWCSPKL